MNATSYTEFRSAGGQTTAQDEQMDQVRELLFGDYHRQSEARLALLEARVRELELGLQRRIEFIEQRVGEMAGKADADQRAAFDELARGISELGERVRHLR